MAEELNKYTQADTIIDVFKAKLGIDKPNHKMTDKEIGHVIRLIGQGAPDTMWVDETPYYGRTGIGVMLSLALYEFPEFYARYELWQRN